MELKHIHKHLVRPAGGFTLIEALIALFVFSVALLGIAALLARSVSVSHSAYLRSLASIQAMDMAERIRANVMAELSDNIYEIDVTTTTDPDASNFDVCKEVAAPAKQCDSAACNKQELADWDRSVWCEQTKDRFRGLLRSAAVTHDSSTNSYEIELKWAERVIKEDNQQAIEEVTPFTWRVSQ